MPGTDPGLVMGTVGYMAPEQVRGRPVDHRADIFAFGAILYEMLSGKRAFQRSTSAETMTAILNEDPPIISQIVQSIPPGLQRVVHRCLEKSPEQRFQSHRIWRLPWKPCRIQASPQPSPSRHRVNTREVECCAGQPPC
jgi:serine/threonine protein kinase